MTKGKENKLRQLSLSLIGSCVICLYSLSVSYHSMDREHARNQ